MLIEAVSIDLGIRWHVVNGGLLLSEFGIQYDRMKAGVSLRYSGTRRGE